MNAKHAQTIVIARCVSCGKKRAIKAGEVALGEMPMCSACGSPMVAHGAKAWS